jgi:hypothetical protein
MTGSSRRCVSMKPTADGRRWPCPSDQSAVCAKSPFEEMVSERIMSLFQKVSEGCKASWLMLTLGVFMPMTMTRG